MAIIDVIKYNSTPNVLAWKYPFEELGTWTQLIVSESQEALLFKGGQALDLFAPGRHTLDTANIPLLSRLINLPFGGRSPFTAEVWFVNKIFSLDVKWGTPSPIQLQDPKYKLFISVRSFGQFGIRIKDSRKFLVKLVGTLPSFDNSNMRSYFRGLYLTKVKDIISTYLIKKQISILEINASLDELSGYLKTSLDPFFSDYGIELVNFFVNDINIPDDDPYIQKLKEALAKRAEMEIIGYNYAQERSFDTLEGAATNPSAGPAGFMGAGMGLGMGLGVGGAFGQQMNTLTQTINIAGHKRCPKCGNDMLPEARFCGRCGADTQEEALSAAAEDKSHTKCSGCGAEYPKTSKFCPKCGKPHNPCVYCGADVDKDAGVCPECGRRLTRPCPQCGVQIEAPDAKFCPKCGTSLVHKCPHCGAAVEQSFKFCPDCGGKL